MYRITRKGTGFHITFENGNTISVQWGPRTGSDNNAKEYEDGATESTTAEVAAWDKNGNYINLGGSDEIVRDVLPDDLVGYITFVRGVTPKEETFPDLDEATETLDSLVVKLDELTKALGVEMKKVARPDNSSDL